MKNTLILNTDYTPLNIVTWQHAICSEFLQKLVVVKHYNEVVRDSMGIEYPVPAVAVVRGRYVKHFRKKIKLSKKNVWVRDKYTCAYCLQSFRNNVKELSVDHVNAKSNGGKSTWLNLITACKSCNRKKGNKSIQPKFQPHEPRNITLFIANGPDEWSEYLYDAV